MVKRVITAFFGLMSGMILVLGLTHIGTAHAQSGSCELVNNLEQMRVFFAPIVADAQLKDILPQGTPYTMIGKSNGFFWIEYGEGQRGWIDFHTRTNGMCDAYQSTYTSPEGDTRLTEFPTICFYTINQALTGYSDSTLTQVHPGFGAYQAGTYAVVDITENAVGLNGTSDMSGGYVDASRGAFSGHCEGTLQLATTLDNTRVWTQPDATTGTVITTLPTGIEVGVLSDAIAGNIQADLVGDWYQVVRGDVIGWIWVDRLTFGRKFTTPQASIAQATVTDNTRIWSAPDAKAGTIITTLLTNTSVNIIGESVTGNIQLDSDLQGDWYPIQFGRTTGWIYDGRLIFSEN